MKRRGMALGLAALMTCTALFTTTAKAENKGSDEKETIKFTYWGSGDEKKAIEESVDKFMEANPNIEVDLMHIPSEDFLTKLNAMIAAGEAPDVSYSASWKCQMGEDGLIYNFYDLLDDMGLSKDDYLSTCWWNWSPTESAGPVQANVTTNLMYNVDCFEEAGVDLPPTKVEEDLPLPLAARPVKLNGRMYLDGGISDPIPVNWMLSQGYEKNVVVCTRHPGYRKEHNKLMPLLRLKFREYPELVKLLDERHIQYNRMLDKIAYLEKEGRIHVIRPDRDISAKPVERDPAHLKEIYEVGRRVMKADMEKLKAYLAE